MYFMLSVLPSNGYNINFIFIFKLPPHLMFNTHFIHEYLVFQGCIFSSHLLGCILKLAQLLSERGAFGERKGFVPFTYLSLERGWYKVLIWHNCRVKVVPLYGCCFASVHVSVNPCL